MIGYLKYIKETYCNRLMLKMLALGFSSGFPFLLTFGTLTYWFKEAGLTLAMIGSFSLVKIPYSLKWLWSPIIDNTKLPVISFLGRRRSWAVLIQILLFLSIFTMSCFNPAEKTSIMAVLAVFIAFLQFQQLH